MKFNISRPPQSGGTEDIRSWLFSLYEKLNAVMSAIDEDNFSEGMKELIESLRQSDGD